MKNKRPRHHAQTIIDMPEILREPSIKQCPEHYQEMIRHYVTDHFRKLDSLSRWVASGTDRFVRKARLESVPLGARKSVESAVVDIYRGRRIVAANAVLSGAATETTTECGASPRPPRTRGYTT